MNAFTLVLLGDTLITPYAPGTVDVWLPLPVGGLLGLVVVACRYQAPAGQAAWHASSPLLRWSPRVAASFVGDVPHPATTPQTALSVRLAMVPGLTVAGRSALGGSDEGSDCDGINANLQSWRHEHEGVPGAGFHKVKGITSLSPRGFTFRQCDCHLAAAASGGLPCARLRTEPGAHQSHGQLLGRSSDLGSGRGCLGWGLHFSTKAPSIKACLPQNECRFEIETRPCRMQSCWPMPSTFCTSRWRPASLPAGQPGRHVGGNTMAGTASSRWQAASNSSPIASACEIPGWCSIDTLFRMLIFRHRHVWLACAPKKEICH